MKNLTFVNDISYHERVPRDDMVHHLLGNGKIQAVVQVTENLSCRNALVLHLMDPARFEDRPKSNSFTFHQQAGPEMTLVSLFSDGTAYAPHPRQTACDLRYGMTYEDDVPAFQANYPAEFDLDGQRRKSPFDVAEQFFCPHQEMALIRRVRVTNRRGLEAAPARLLVFLVPNQSLFPEAHYLSDTDAAVAGYFEAGDEFLGIGGMTPSDGHQVAEFPIPFDDGADGVLGNLAPSCDDENFVRPQQAYTNYPLLPGSAHLGPVLSLSFDLGMLQPGSSRHIEIIYACGNSQSAVINTIETLRSRGIERIRAEVGAHWAGTNFMQTGDAALDEMYQATRAGIQAGVAGNGRMNAAIWGYNAEWVRDSSCASLGPTFSGQFRLARAMLDHILTNLIGPDGMAFGESQFYEPRRAELDQNGECIHAIWQYWVHSRDDALIRRHWDKIKRVAAFPVGPDFWVEEASMVKSERDQRDRDAERHGLIEGFELSHQMWTSIGLSKGADMAALMGEQAVATEWRALSERIWHAALHHPRFQFVENGHLMKRRLLDGSFQRFAQVIPYVHRIDDSTTRVYPRNRRRQGELEPDGSEAWPIALGMVDPDSELARRTLRRMELLWNAEWDFGGYALHHPGSDPTKVGAWPMIFYFVTQAALETRNYDIVRRNFDWILSTKDGRGYTWWEYRDADPALQIDHGITPWFIYGEALFTFVHHMLGYRPSPNAITICPHLLPEFKQISARLRCGDHWLTLKLHSAGPCIERVSVEGAPVRKQTTDSVEIGILQNDATVEIWLGENTSAAPAKKPAA